MVTFSSAGSHFWTGGHIVSNMLYKDTGDMFETYPPFVLNMLIFGLVMRFVTFSQI